MSPGDDMLKDNTVGVDGTIESSFVHTLERGGNATHAPALPLQHCQADAHPRCRLQSRPTDAERYRHGLVPPIAPLTIVRHYVRTLKVEYLLGQTYLDPHPRELMLRNRV
jgi:hypothetical protein